MKKSSTSFLVLLIVITLSLSLVSAGFFSNLFGRITGSVTEKCTDFDGGLDYSVKASCEDSVQLISDECSETPSVLNEAYCSDTGCEIQTYTCPNGCQEGACVEEPEPEPEPCDDGTILWECSETQPKYCIPNAAIGQTSPEFIDKCQECGCPENQICQGDGTCTEEAEPEPEQMQCDDGTLPEQCSETKPKYCVELTTISGTPNYKLLDKCSLCSCPENQECQEDETCLPLADEENQKSMEQYSEKEVFIISDKNWQDVLSLVSVTTWTDGEEIKKYPTLIYHEESDESRSIVLKRNILEDSELTGYFRFQFSESPESSSFSYSFDLPRREYERLQNDPSENLVLSFSIEGYGSGSGDSMPIPSEVLENVISNLMVNQIPLSEIPGKGSSFELTIDNAELVLNNNEIEYSGEDYAIEQFTIKSPQSTEDFIVVRCGKHEDSAQFCIDDIEYDVSMIMPNEEFTGAFKIKNIGDTIELSPNEHSFILRLSTNDETCLNWNGVVARRRRNCVRLSDLTFSENTIEPGDTININFEGSYRITPPPTSFDADSIIHFLQQYPPDSLTIIGETPSELDELLVAEPELGAGLDVEKMQRIEVEDYFGYWESISSVVYVEDDYELALMASTYASLLNAPLIVQGSTLDVPAFLEDKQIICIGNPSGVECSEQYNLEQLQQKYMDLTNTDKVILVNPDDLKTEHIYAAFEEMGVSNIFPVNPEKSGNSIFAYFHKTSLISPFLASAKHELILSTTETDSHYIDLFLEPELLELNPEYLTVFATIFSIPHAEFSGSQYGYSFYRALDQSKYGDLNHDQEPDIAVGRIMGYTSSDVSSYVSRVLFYEELQKTNNMKFMGSSAYVHIRDANQWSDKFGQAGYNAVASTSENNQHNFDPSEWENQDLISYGDHGASTWAGIYSVEIPPLNNPVVSAYACSTCAGYYDEDHIMPLPTPFCVEAMKQGALAFIGAVSTAWTSDIYKNTLNAIYYEDLSIGLAFKKTYDSHYMSNMNTLIGDPTIQLNPPYLLNEPL